MSFLAMQEIILIQSPTINDISDNTTAAGNYAKVIYYNVPGKLTQNI